MRDERKFRIVDIASELGVRTAAASNVIHGKTKEASDTTVREVQELLAERGHLPDIAAALLALNNPGMAAMFFCEDVYQKLRDQIRIAFVVYDGYFKNDRNICSLIVDDFEGGREAGHYFREHHRHKVLCIANSWSKPDCDRYEGLCNGISTR